MPTTARNSASAVIMVANHMFLLDRAYARKAEKARHVQSHEFESS